MKLENLAPAGNREALDRAAAAGADAVYLGYAAFSARAGAGNFDEEQLREAVEAAQNADVAVLVLGDNSNFFGGIGWGDSELDGTVAVTCGEGFDMHTLELPGRQQALLEAIYATGTPVVLVLETGRPYAVCWAK